MRGYLQEDGIPLGRMLGAGGRAGVVPWLPARGDAVPGTGKQHLCNSLNSISPSHLAALGMQSLGQKQVPGGSFIRKVAMEVFEGFSMATGQCHCSRERCHHCHHHPGRCAEAAKLLCIPGTFSCPQCPSFPGSAWLRAEAFWEPEDSRGDLIPRVFSWLPLLAPTPRR